MTADEGILVLDKTDLTILSTLPRNCKCSYGSTDSEVGLTSKSIKAQVKKMIHQRVIEKFVVRVNPATFGFKIDYAYIKADNGVTKDDVIQRIKHLVTLHTMYITSEEHVLLP